MGIDPEFDPFLERMPASDRFYLDLKHFFAERVETIIGHFKQIDPELDLPLASYSVEFKGPRVSVSVAGADIVSIQSLRFGHDSLEGYSDDSYSSPILMYKDGLPFTRNEDEQWQPAGNPQADYFLMAWPETKPVLILAEAFYTAQQTIQERHPGKAYTNRQVFNELLNNGYIPYTLNDNECEAFLKAINTLNLDFTLMRDYWAWE